MSNLQKMHYKQCSPEETVEKLQSILKSQGLELTESWQNESSIGTYALRLTFSGTNIGTNGKGINRSYAQASAYAEFFERFQNDVIGNTCVLDPESSFLIAPDEKKLNTKELISQNNSFFEQYFRSRGLENSSIEEKAKCFRSTQRGDYFLYGYDDEYVTVPFYSLKTKSLTYLPKSTYTIYHGSNGMCAGNSPEEALVQGLSEIIERIVQRKCFLEKPTFPDVPEDYIKKFPYIFELVQKLKEQESKGYRFWIKDCSFGGKYPVAALIIYEINTGRYGFKLGCHPDFGVAIERTLTEATQGQDLDGYAKRSTIDFSNSLATDTRNITNSYKIGMGQYPYQLFDETPTYPFTPVKDVSKLGNKEIMQEWIKEIQNEGYEILIRNVSYFGFPSFHIIIPGLSEIFYPDDVEFRAFNSRRYLASILNNSPEMITRENCKLFIATLDYFSGNVLENTMLSIYGIAKENDIPCESIECGFDYLIAMLYAMLEDYEKAQQKMKVVLKKADKALQDGSLAKGEFNYIMGVSYYFNAARTIKSHSDIMRFMKIMFDETVCDRLHYVFSDPTKIITRQYPGIECGGLALKERYSDLVDIVCRYTHSLRSQQAINPIDQREIQNLFV